MGHNSGEHFRGKISSIMYNLGPDVSSVVCISEAIYGDLAFLFHSDIIKPSVFGLPILIQTSIRF